jgi:hypothetical protein
MRNNNVIFGRCATSCLKDDLDPTGINRQDSKAHKFKNSGTQLKIHRSKDLYFNFAIKCYNFQSTCLHKMLQLTCPFIN